LAEGGEKRGAMYLCCSLHQMFNIVTNEKDTPHAILMVIGTTGWCGSVAAPGRR